MCDALRELMADVIENEKRSGERNGEKRVNDLISKLLELGRMDDIGKAVKNPDYQQKLFQEFGL